MLRRIRRSSSLHRQVHDVEYFTRVPIRECYEAGARLDGLVAYEVLGAIHRVGRGPLVYLVLRD